MGQGGSTMQLPAGADRDLPPLILPLLPSSSPTPLSPVVVPSLQVFVPLPTAGWPAVVTQIPERKERESQDRIPDCKGKFSAN